MTDSWVPSPLPPTPQPPTLPGLPPSNAWNAAAPCTTSGAPPSITGSIVLTDRPATIVATPWRITVNDGGSPPNFTIDQTDSSGNVIDSPLVISGADGSVSVFADPDQPLEVATKQYVDRTTIAEAPTDGQSYVRTSAAWTVQPRIIPEAPNTSQIFGRMNSVWAAVPIQADAPNDGTAYARQSGAWTAAVTGGPYLPLTGGTITGSLTVNQVLTVQGSNSLVLNAPVTGGSQRAILGMAANISRWGLTLGDGTAEGAGNAGANFSLAAYGVTGGFLGNWLTIARADGSTVLNGPVTMNAGLGVNGSFALQGPGNFILPGGAAAQVLTTNGSAVLSWSGPYAPLASPAFTGTPTAPTPAPGDNDTSIATTAFVTAAVAGSVAGVSSIDFSPTGLTPGPGATGAVTVGGVLNVANGGMGGATHVLNGVLIGAGANAIKASAAAPGAGALLIGAAAAVPTWLGVGANGTFLSVASGTPAWAALTSSNITTALGFTPYNATNPSGYQTAAQVTASLGAYLPLAGGTLTGALTPSQTAGVVGTTTNNNAAVGAIGEFISSAVSAPGTTLTTTTPANATSISLTAGDWDVSGEVWFNVGTGGATALQAGIGSTSATLPTPPGPNGARASLAAAVTASSFPILPLARCRMSLAATTTVYLVAYATFPSGTTSAYGVISARRVR
jgi:hypothetical protein